MTCEGCGKESKRTVYNPKDKQWLCQDCRDPNLIKPNIHMNFEEYVKQESETILRDKTLKGVSPNKYTDRENWRDNFSRRGLS